ncbi:MAG: hypothetical protein M1826_002444 [Phylliscum demangeonii]|nr:MAG: hypothetical protein M1826_002444 [Phylliscum demangeonii]
MAPRKAKRTLAEAEINTVDNLDAAAATGAATAGAANATATADANATAGAAPPAAKKRTNAKTKTKTGAASATATTGATKKARTATMAAADRLPAQFLLMCRPSWDRADSDSDDEDAPPPDPMAGPKPDAIDTLFGVTLAPSGHAMACVCGKAVDAVPDGARWPWRATTHGWDLIEKVQEAVFARDQDMHQMHIYNDWTGYGMQEVMENELVAFDTAVRRWNVDPVRVWAQLEAMAILVNMDMGPWYMTDCCEPKYAVMALFGTALLTGLDLLKRERLLTPLSPISNIPLVVSLFFRFVHVMADLALQDGEAGWRKPVLKMLDAAGIVLVEGTNAARQTALRVQEIREEIIADEEADADDDDDDEDDDDAEVVNGKKSGKKWSVEDDLRDGVRQWKRWDWPLELEAYSHDFGQLEEWFFGPVVGRGGKGGKGGNKKAASSSAAPAQTTKPAQPATIRTTTRSSAKKSRPMLVHDSETSVKEYAIGGDEYVIAKMTAAQRKKHSYGSAR